MVDRHNNVIKDFEVRMNHLQKLLAEKRKPNGGGSNGIERC